MTKLSTTLALLIFTAAMCGCASPSLQPPVVQAACVTLPPPPAEAMVRRQANFRATLQSDLIGAEPSPTK